ncbi:MAG: hypothetical protein WCW77_03155 [Patescibacteria group bacterium]|jgi:hypothetical protein
MKLKDFIKKLKTIEKTQGGNCEVIMADNIPVVSPIFSESYQSKKKVVITDR